MIRNNGEKTPMMLWLNSYEHGLVDSIPIAFSCEHVLFGDIIGSEVFGTRYDLSATIRSIDTARRTLAVSRR